MIRRSCLAALVFLAACSKPAPTPCRIGSDPLVARFDAKGWAHPKEQMLDEAPNGWIGSFALSPDGQQAVYANALAGDFIPTSDGVSMMRINLADTVDRHPAVVELPFPALRNYAAIHWSTPGMAWATWSAFGTADPAIGKATVLDRIIKAGSPPPTFPLYSSAALAPGGDCVAVILDREDATGELQAWKSGGATGASHTQKVLDRESIVSWDSSGVLLVKAPPIVSSTSMTVAASTARRLDPVSGSTAVAPAPPAAAEAFAWTGTGWLWIDRSGGIRFGNTAAPLVTLKATLEPNEKLKQHHRWQRLFVSENGRTIAAEEATIGPRWEKRALHVILSAGN